MLTSDEFERWCQKLGLTEQTIKQISHVRSSPPARLVHSSAGNVSGRYPSQKMGVTIQFESHRNELAGIYEMEYDPEVLEYYDQPPQIKLLYQAKNGRKVGVLHIPDFFVLRTRSAGWEEWKTVDELGALATQMPLRYQLGSDAIWRCPPGESYALELGLYYVIRTNNEVDWNLQRNLRLLEDYFRGEQSKIDKNAISKTVALVTCFPGITLAELLSEQVNADEIYTLIATQQVYVNLREVALASSPELVKIFPNKETATTQGDNLKKQKNSQPAPLISIEVGMSLGWNGKVWEIVNLGSTQTALLSEEQKLVQLPNQGFEELIRTGEITGVSSVSQYNDRVKQLLEKASSSDCAEANRRYQIIAEYLVGAYPDFSEVSERTKRERERERERGRTRTRLLIIIKGND